MVKILMQPLGDRISGNRRGVRGFGSCRMNCRSDLLLPRTAARVLVGSHPVDGIDLAKVTNAEVPYAAKISSRPAK